MLGVGAANSFKVPSGTEWYTGVRILRFHRGRRCCSVRLRFDRGCGVDMLEIRTLKARVHFMGDCRIGMPCLLSR